MSDYKAEEGKAGCILTVSEDGKQIWLRGTWEGRTSKSKKGNMNMSWHPREMFDEVVAQYLGKAGSGDKEPEGDTLF